MTIKTFSVHGVERLQEVLVSASEFEGGECVSWTEYRVDTSDRHGTVEDFVEYETNKWRDRGYREER
ncbi:MAG: hypothetical protein GY721_05610 [Deltaproteobacteria bacterium]|nr:hypothetical protein [Deltaproteobacteria bacterium]